MSILEDSICMRDSYVSISLETSCRYFPLEKFINLFRLLNFKTTVFPSLPLPIPSIYLSSSLISYPTFLLLLSLLLFFFLFILSPSYHHSSYLSSCLYFPLSPTLSGHSISFTKPLHLLNSPEKGKASLHQHYKKYRYI